MDANDALAAAVRVLLTDPRRDPGFEVRDAEQAARAVALLDEGLRNGLGVFRLMAEGGQQGAETLSSDGLQILSEMVQNADDTGAREIRFVWRPSELLIAHDGHGVRLADLLLLGMPWLSGKTRDAEATGRFGIGLATLRALSRSWEVHCHPFHVRFTDLELAVAEPLELPAEIADERWTVFRIPLVDDVLPAAGLVRWFEGWSDGSLLFLRHLERITVAADGVEADGGRSSTVLRLSWREIGRKRLVVGGAGAEVGVREAVTTDGSVWRVYDTQVDSPAGAARRNKASGATMPVAVALPLRPGTEGSVHAGLPVASLDVAARVHAQFDPVANREGFAASRLNDALVPLVADLWEAAVLDVLGGVAPSAWHLIPLPPQPGDLAPAGLPHTLRAELLDRARGTVAGALVLPLGNGESVPLTDLAVEAAALSGVLDSADVARLGGLPHPYPATARDAEGRWRRVLADWRFHGVAALGEEVDIARAVGLLSQPEYEVGRTIRLSAVAIDAGLGRLIAREPCIVTADGRRLAPQSHAHAFAASEGSGPLDVLGIVADLHPAYRAEDRWARSVVGWLRQSGALLRRDDTRAVLRRVAELGDAGARLHGDDDRLVEQLVALQKALGEVSKKDQEAFGRRIGRAVVLNCFGYGPDGKEMRRRKPPGEAYLSKPLETTEGDRFAVAAGKAPGLTWVDRSYARSLVPSTRNNGLGPGGFLRLLGVADTPRLTPVRRGRHTKEYSGDYRVGTAREFAPSLEGRATELGRLNATYTLDDLESPALQVVVHHIVAEPDPRERLRRTAALLATLGKPGMLTSPDHARVKAAWAYHRWEVRGSTPALWVWRLRKTAWLEDTRGHLRTPAELRLRTRDSEALYGHDDPGYLHPEIQRLTTSWREVLAALGVAADPDVPELIARLRELRRRPANGPEGEALDAEVLLVYRALAGRLADGLADPARTAAEKEIRTAFLGRVDLVLTDRGWRRPPACLRGRSVLRGFRPYVLAGPELVPLWTALGIREPGADDLLDVLREIAEDDARPTGARQQVMLEALRSLSGLVGSTGSTAPIALRNRLRALPLWTGAGWTRKRPVHAVDHPGIARALADRVPIWQPGGEVSQFTALLGLLKVTRLEAAGARVLDPDGAVPDPELTHAYRRAVAGLQDILVRDEPAAADAFTGWGWLPELEVRILPGLRIRLDLDGGGEAFEVPVEAQIDREAKALFVANREALRTTHGGGTAVASFFDGERTRVGHRWRDFWEAELLDRPPGAEPLVSARQQDHEQEQRLRELLAHRERQLPVSPPVPATARRAPAPALPRPRNGAAPVPPVPAPAPAPVPAPAPPTGSRELYTVAELARRRQETRPALSDGVPRPGGVTQRRRAASLPKPRPGAGAPQERSGPLGYADRDKEKLVIELLGEALRQDGITLDDQRGVQGFGADAIDSTGHYYEIKTHGGALPAEVSLTRQEFVRALTEGDNLSLVLASHLERGKGDPTLRIVRDPVRHFEVEPVAEIRLKVTQEVAEGERVLRYPDGGPEWGAAARGCGLR
ncbi:ATP-binding protein [Kitasatospora griseola]|uniref:ATP-binding protein n=1 Tax=Kitasatospora griseola TaxID=2064 RepID=UPI0038259F2B